MKKIKILGLILTVILIYSGCEKLKDPAGKRNVAVVPVISNVQPGIFDSKDLVNSYVEFTVSLGSTDNVDGAVVEVSYNTNLERTQVTQVSSFPSTIRLVSGDVIQKLGISQTDVHNGDDFLVEVLTTKNGVTTRSNAIINISVACAFQTTLTVGSYHSVSPDWNSSGNITLTADPTDPYTINVKGIEAIEGVDEDKGPLVMHIDPSTFAVTADKSVIASVAFGYHNFTYAGTGTYNSCDGSYVMVFDISADEGDFGSFNFTFTRNP